LTRSAVWQIDRQQVVDLLDLIDVLLADHDARDRYSICRVEVLGVITYLVVTELISGEHCVFKRPNRCTCTELIGVLLHEAALSGSDRRIHDVVSIDLPIGAVRVAAGKYIRTPRHIHGRHATLVWIESRRCRDVGGRILAAAVTCTDECSDETHHQND
jgi:hypothetical protein